MKLRLRRRYLGERLFRGFGLLAILVAMGFLAFLLVSMTWTGISGFGRTDVATTFDFPALALPLDSATLTGDNADYALAAAGIPAATERALGPAAAAVSDAAWLTVRDALKADPSLLGQRATLLLPASSAIELAERGAGTAEDNALYQGVKAKGLIHHRFNWPFLTGSDATGSNAVGIWGAFKGSLLTMLVTLVLAFPVGVLSAVYLEEYAPKNRWTDLIEVSINNLAAVPSIIFGLLGLAVFLNIFHMPRSAPLVGGLTLALMTMPVIVIAARNAIKAVPPSIRDAALGIGASPVQVVTHHVLPLALPGILTGTIIAMSRALGETAPLLMIGMRVFLSTPPQSLTDPATVLPMQIFLWSDEVGRGFIEKTSAAIIVLLVFLLAMNGVAIYLRDRFETRW